MKTNVDKIPIKNTIHYKRFHAELHLSAAIIKMEYPKSALLVLPKNMVFMML